MDEVRFVIGASCTASGCGAGKAPGCGPTTAIAIDTTRSDAGVDIKLSYDETLRRNETPDRHRPSWATVGCWSAVGTAA